MLGSVDGGCVSGSRERHSGESGGDGVKKDDEERCSSNGLVDGENGEAKGGDATRDKGKGVGGRYCGFGGGGDDGVGERVEG